MKKSVTSLGLVIPVPEGDEPLPARILWRRICPVRDPGGTRNRDHTNAEGPNDGFDSRVGSERAENSADVMPYRLFGDYESVSHLSRAKALAKESKNLRLARRKRLNSSRSPTDRSANWWRRHGIAEGVNDALRTDDRPLRIPNRNGGRQHWHRIALLANDPELVQGKLTLPCDVFAEVSLHGGERVRVEELPLIFPDDVARLMAEERLERSLDRADRAVEIEGVIDDSLPAKKPPRSMTILLFARFAHRGGSDERPLSLRTSARRPARPGIKSGERPTLKKSFTSPTLGIRSALVGNDRHFPARVVQLR